MGNPDFTAQARRAAATLIAEHELDSAPLNRDSLVTAMAVAWLEGYGAGSTEVMHIAERSFLNLKANLSELTAD